MKPFALLAALVFALGTAFAHSDSATVSQGTVKSCERHANKDKACCKKKGHTESCHKDGHAEAGSKASCDRKK